MLEEFRNHQVPYLHKNPSFIFSFNYALLVSVIHRSSASSMSWLILFFLLFLPCFCIQDMLY